MTTKIMSNPVESRWISAGFSPEAQLIWRGRVPLSPSSADQIWIQEQIKSNLQSLAKGCAIEGWDGYDAQPISSETYQLALRVTSSLPASLPSPSIGAEPDGHITLEWHRNSHRTLSVSISPEGYLHFAAILGAGSNQYGTEIFWDSVPKTILELIYNIMCL